MNPIVEKQRNFFNTHQTLDVSFRVQTLKTLRKAILAYEDKINDALFKDLGKSNFESYMCEVGLVLS